MIKKILIANRGEIAVRIIRTCKKMGIKTVAVYSTCDKDSLHVFMADEAICIGKESALESYLNINNIVMAAINTKCDAIHPGYGFLSENEQFASKIEENNLIFIGPSAKGLKSISNKFNVKSKVEKLGIPVINGCTIKDFKNKVKKVDYPFLLKSSYGGGGKGIKKISSLQEFEDVYKLSQKEMQQAFNNSEMYIEKLVDAYKHIEIQLMADNFGNIICLPERDCSIQIQNKKIIEESPSIINENLISKLKSDAKKIFEHFRYNNLGTVEFIIDKNNNYYFLEVNARLQVEHTVTEMVTGLDLVEKQIIIADGYSLEKEVDYLPKGHSIECRINAVDVENNFLPSVGQIKFLNIPTGNNIRVETYLYQGYSIKPYYDPLVMKLISYDKTRELAIKKIQDSLDELIITGIKSDIEYNYKIISGKDYIKGDYSLM
ncbi:MAG: biotin carboxylase N-terminal domain-containing protein [Bacilli bacterium]|nr:biotin carboxylase N-terminal domain-containing protein [Bacilli bacterium]MDD4809228.1 biotin carboxylase N-terminal domain-containing protein [Bacilli bacterium]